MKKKTVKRLIGLILILISYGYIMYKLLKFDELKSLDFYSIINTNNNFIFFISALLLMPINWCVETIKWRKLIESIQKLGFFYSYQAVFAGISMGIFTPNRIGEIGGRILFLEKGKRTYALLATSLGSFAQLITTIIAGLVGLIYLLKLYPGTIHLSVMLHRLFIVVVIILLSLLLWLYFNTKSIKPILLKFSFFKSRENQISFFSDTKPSLLLQVIVLSMIRYMIFFVQFYLFLHFFDIDLTIAQTFISVSLIYLFSALIPTTTLIELGIKGSLAIFFIGLFSTNYIGIVLSTIFLWIINLAIPALIGSIFFLKKNIL
ncbi:MAG: hypothetical protein C0597_04150 [Marinilabiliales bacterium]|nr:MAG: hypothetical protein C0597_04150 [Marinilabiliales bacterium]